MKLEKRQLEDFLGGGGRATFADGDVIVGPLVEGPPAAIQLLEFLDVAGQRPVGGVTDSGADQLQGSIEPDRDAMVLYEVDVFGAGEASAAHGDDPGHAARDLVDAAVQRGGFKLAEFLLPALLEDFGNGELLVALNILIEIRKPPAEMPGNGPAHGGLARAHESDKPDTGSSFQLEDHPLPAPPLPVKLPHSSNRSHNTEMQHSLLPLFPLPLVLLPGRTLPLHIFEERYKEMISEAWEAQAEFGVVRALADGIVRTGCTARVDSIIKRYEDGKMDILTVGVRRFVIGEVDTERSFLRASVTFFDDNDPDPGQAETQHRAIEAFNEYARQTGKEAGAPDQEHPRLSFLLAGVSDDLDFLQALLGMQSEAERIGKVAEHIEQLLTHQQLRNAMRKAAASNGHGPHRREPNS